VQGCTLKRPAGTSGPAVPLDGYLAAAAAARVTTTWRLPDGTPWVLPLQLPVPAALLHEASVHRAIVLTDPEGTPLARLDVAEAGDGPHGGWLAGPVSALRPPAHGPFRSLRRHPADVAAEPAGEPVLGATFRSVPGADQPRRRRRLADAGGAQQHHVPLPARIRGASSPTARGREVTDDVERGDLARDVGDRSHACEMGSPHRQPMSPVPCAAATFGGANSRPRICGY